MEPKVQLASADFKINSGLRHACILVSRASPYPFIQHLLQYIRSGSSGYRQEMMMILMNYFLYMSRLRTSSEKCEVKKLFSDLPERKQGVRLSAKNFWKNNFSNYVRQF